MKKAVKIGCGIQSVMYIAILLLVLFQQPIPDIVQIGFGIGTAICVISSLFARNSAN